MDSKTINLINQYVNKYKYSLHSDFIPIVHIPDTITEVSYDLNKIKLTISENTGKDSVRESTCQQLKRQLIDILEYLKQKLEQFLDCKLDVKALE